MSTIKKNRKITKLKTGILLLLLFTWKLTTIQAQEKKTNEVAIETQVDRDFKELDSLVWRKYILGDAYEVAIKSGFLEFRQFEDSINKNRTRLVKAFWDKYPNNHEAFNLFFNPYLKPHFIPEVISDSLSQLIRSRRAGSRKDMSVFRLSPLDHKAMEKWLKTGDDMVASILNSNASIEFKELAELHLIGREFRSAILLRYKGAKDKWEADYWNRFEIQYWKFLCLQLEKHVNKYASLEVAADHVKHMLTLLKIFSSSAQEAYWNYFYKITGSNHPQADQAGIKALHKIAEENIAAINALKEVDGTKPIEMTFTAMDGSKVNLADMRGKPVLIDFWATTCGPCIKEMPHVQAMYNKYKEQGFEVLGIAADGDGAREKIEAILKKTGANWPQLLDRGSDASVSFHALYKITTLPTVWLLNKEGVIVDRDARGTRLEPLIRKYLGLE